MPPELRPRQQAAPSDHSYASMPGMPVYCQAPIVVSGPGGIFTDRVPPLVHSPSDTPHKKKRKRYFGDKKRRYKTKRIIIRQSTASQGKRPVSATVSRPPDEPEHEVCDQATQSDLTGFDSFDFSRSSNTVTNAAETATNPDNAPHDWSGGLHSCCNDCGFKWKRFKKSDSLEDRRHSARLVKKNYKLPFNQLPHVAKLHIFSFLTLKERGAAALVCEEWAQLMRSPRLWCDIDFTVFDAPIQKLKHGPQQKIFQFRWFTSCTEYNDYRQRILMFLDFLKKMKPRLEFLRFAYDIAHPKDEWLQVLLTFLSDAQCQDLVTADIDWTNTPVRPPCADIFCCLFNKVRVLYTLHVSRIKKFHVLLDRLSKVAVNLSNVTIPFDFSPRSVLLLSRFKELRILRLKKHVLVKPLDQYMVDTLLESLPNLQQLELQICMPAYSSQQLYRISHKYLQVLDVTMCQGFFINSMDLPELHTICIGRMPWKGPLVVRENNKIPCLYEILKVGAPKLAQVNKHRVQAYWVEYMYEELDSALERLCPCKDHTLNWNLP